MKYFAPFVFIVALFVGAPQAFAAAPSASISANPTAILSGDTAKLSYSCKNATSASVDNGIGAVDPSRNGSSTVSPTTTTTYTLTCTGSGGTDTATVTINVSDISGTCSVSPTSGNANTVFTWTAIPSGGTGAYTYKWNSPLSGTATSTTKVYGTNTGTKTGAVDITSGGFTTTVSCSNSATVYGMPDLTAGTTYPASATAGTASTFSSLISNTGNADTGSSFWNLFQVATDASGTGAKDIGTYVSPPLAQGSGTNVATLSYTFPSAGTFYMRTCADKSSAGDTGSITELYEDNNCGAWSAVTVSPAIVATLSTNPTYGPKGTVITLSYSCTNSSSAKIDNGVGTLSPVSSGSVQTTLGNGDTTYTLTCTGAGGTTATASATVTLGTSPGATATIDSPADKSTYYVNQPIVLDGHGAPDDPSTYTYAWYPNSGCSGAPAYTSRTITISYPAKNNNVNYCLRVTSATGVVSKNDPSISFDVADSGPDLTAGNVAISPASPPAGTFATISATISNIGSQTANPSTAFLQYATDSSGASATAVDVYAMPRTDNVSPGRSKDISAPYAVFSVPGTFYIRACADKSSASDPGIINEIDETNNCSAWTSVTIAPTTLTANVCRQGASCNTAGTWQWSTNHIDGQNCTEQVLPRDSVTLVDGAYTSIKALNKDTNGYWSGTETLQCRYGMLMELDPTCTYTNTGGGGGGTCGPGLPNSYPAGNITYWQWMSNGTTVSCAAPTPTAGLNQTVDVVDNDASTNTGTAGSTGDANLLCEAQVQTDGSTKYLFSFRGHSCFVGSPPACGTAAGGSYPSGTLCANGTASSVTTDGTTYSWSCSIAGSGQSSTVSCSSGGGGGGGAVITPACGSANGQPTLSAPASNLCSAGTASAVSSGNNYTWTCAGTSSTASCAAQNLSACTWHGPSMAYCGGGPSFADCSGHSVTDGAAYTGGPYYNCSFYNAAASCAGGPGVGRDFSLSCP